MPKNKDINNLINLKEFVTTAKIENLDAVKDFITGELAACNCTAKLQTQLALVVEEIFVNIVYYAYSEDTWASSLPREQPSTAAGNVAIRIAVGDEVIIEFEDCGKPYNPLEKDDPDITLDAEKREVGGLGILLVKSIADAIKYRYEDNKNILLIKKKVA
ncbi:MAG: ATP-binding protein [Firmicutes bacterium]|nr:ATP-binding protein [Bacillota bacterium]